jgi:hypothetical protein
LTVEGALSETSEMVVKESISGLVVWKRGEEAEEELCWLGGWVTRGGELKSVGWARGNFILPDTR